MGGRLAALNAGRRVSPRGPIFRQRWLDTVDFQSLPPGLIIAAIVLAFLALAALGAWQAAKRRKELRAWASSKGLSFHEGRDHGFDERHGEFSCLRQGDHRYAYNIARGDWAGRRVETFDYHYETHSHDSRGRRQTHHHHFSAIILHSALPLRGLFIRPEGLFDKVTEFFGFDDIDFESAEFSRTFYVKAEDRRWAFDVLHARTMQFLLDSPRFSIQFGPRCVIAWRASRFGVADFEAAIEVVRGMLDRFPEYLVNQLKGLG